MILDDPFTCFVLFALSSFLPPCITGQSEPSTLSLWQSESWWGEDPCPREGGACVYTCTYTCIEITLFTYDHTVWIRMYIHVATELQVYMYMHYPLLTCLESDALSSRGKLSHLAELPRLSWWPCPGRLLQLHPLLVALPATANRARQTRLLAPHGGQAGATGTCTEWDDTCTYVPIYMYVHTCIRICTYVCVELDLFSLLHIVMSPPPTLLPNTLFSPVLLLLSFCLIPFSSYICTHTYTHVHIRIIMCRHLKWCSSLPLNRILLTTSCLW